ncbi:transposase [Shewanella zhuhaiensis]|uniref:transposase n=1 Tax=Shewanella zhuhaiensis TaxID=2919576 RepID=UPI003B845C1D
MHVEATQFPPTFFGGTDGEQAYSAITEEKLCLSYLFFPRQQFTGEDISKLYRLRWQIELLFKEWKSHNNLRRFATCQPHLVEGLIWSSLLSLLVKRYLCRAATTQAMLRLSLFKMAKTPALSQS